MDRLLRVDIGIILIQVRRRCLGGEVVLTLSDVAGVPGRDEGFGRDKQSSSPPSSANLR